MTGRRWVQPLVLSLALGFTLVAPVLANGGKAKSTIYEGSARPQSENGNDVFRFTIETNPVIFYLGTVNNKYHVLLIRVVNQSSVPLKLAKDRDTVELHFANGQSVKGLLNLSAADEATWSSLEMGIRIAVAYPEAVKAGEEEGIYLYVPVKDLAGSRKDQIIPDSIIYSIKSLPSPIHLLKRGLTAP